MATVDTVDVSCYQAADGSLSANVQGGSGSYAYNWSNGGTAASITDIAAGKYSVTISDGSCPEIVFTNLTVTQPNAFVATVDTVDVSCYQAADGSLSANVQGGSAPTPTAGAMEALQHPLQILPRAIIL
ncbi:MAG: hypothetical protein HC896_12245 [Bacteroidales bacterium]|nr:hypothetical protein [Bacteroidales bacterium]